MIGQLVLFGASGDLTGRFLLPALAQLGAAGALPDGFTVMGSAQSDWTTDDFRRFAEDRLAEHSGDVPGEARAALLSRLHYCPGDVTDPASVASVFDAASEVVASGMPVAAYLALPTSLVAPAIEALPWTQLPQGSRIAVEKPFGQDQSSARALNTRLADVVGDRVEEAVFRVDHALGMTTLANLMALRFDNRVLEALWSSEHIDEVEVLWEETLALEGRAGFYDGAGALKDVVQNHMMQLLCITAMEPAALDEDRSAGRADAVELRNRKAEVLRAVRPLSAGDIVSNTRRARYSAGRLADAGGADGSVVPDYAEESGVEEDRGTETYAELVLHIDNPRWSGTRFVLRAGKALPERRKGVHVHFRPVPGDDGAPRNDLWVGIDEPNTVVLNLTGVATDGTAAGSSGLGSSGPGPSASMALAASQPTGSLTPYAEVLLNLLQGRGNLSVGAEEAEEAWRILDPVRRAWDENRVPLLEYPAGTPGPIGD